MEIFRHLWRPSDPKVQYDELIVELLAMFRQHEIEKMYAYVAKHIRTLDTKFMEYLDSFIANGRGAKELAQMRQVLVGARFTATVGSIGPEQMTKMVSDPGLTQQRAYEFVRNFYRRFGDAGLEPLYLLVSECSQSADALGGSCVDRRNLHILLEVLGQFGMGE